jgi:uncharacterized UBP type Zn finger protein
MFMPDQDVCEDIQEITALKLPKDDVCEECILTGSKWVHLRTCQTCGVTLCCDASPNRHMTAHNRDTAHPVIISAEPGEHWLYCYPHDQIVEYA